MLPVAAYSKIILEHILKKWIVDWIMFFNSCLGVIHGPSLFHVPSTSVHPTLVYGYKFNINLQFFSPRHHHPAPLSRNLGTLTSWSTLGRSKPVMGLLYLHLSSSVVAT